jgi:hypothetical protein
MSEMQEHEIRETFMRKETIFRIPGAYNINKSKQRAKNNGDLGSIYGNSSQKKRGTVIIEETLTEGLTTVNPSMHNSRRNSPYLKTRTTMSSNKKEKKVVSGIRTPTSTKGRQSPNRSITRSPTGKSPNGRGGSSRNSRASIKSKESAEELRIKQEKLKKTLMEEDQKAIVKQTLGLSIDRIKERLPELLEHSGMQYKILNPELNKYEQALEAMRKYQNDSIMNKGQERVERMLRKIRNQEVRLNKIEDNIGGNELLIDEMINQSNTKKGYISK